MKYGDVCRLIGWLNEGAIFMYIGPTGDGWTWVLCLVGDNNNFYEGRVAKANSALEPVE